MVNSKQARTAKRIDPHVQCRRDYGLLQDWLKNARSTVLEQEATIHRLKKDLGLWRAAAIGLAVVSSTVYALWLIWPAFK